MKNGKALAAMLVITGGLSAVTATSAKANCCGAYSQPLRSFTAQALRPAETAEQRDARLAQVAAKRELRRLAKAEKKAAKLALAAAATPSSVPVEIASK